MQFVCWPCVMINLQWFKLPISNTTFHGPKDVRAIEVWLYIVYVNRLSCRSSQCFNFDTSSRTARNIETTLCQWCVLARLWMAREHPSSGHMTFIQRCLNVDATSWRCIDVEATLYKRHVPTGHKLNPRGHMTSIQRRLNVDATSWRCIDDELTLYKRHVPAETYLNLCRAHRRYIF